MIDALWKLLEPVTRNTGELPSAELELAAAVLLVEVARADYEKEQSEYGVLLRRLEQRFALDRHTAVDLLGRAQVVADDAVSLHQHTALINERYDRRQKFELICALWAVAYGDGELHHYEEHLIRRLADLLYVPHADFIRAKHLTMPRE